jgi:AraC-like DNA-binding protein
MPAVVRYREFRPCEALRDCVRGLFSFAPAQPYEPPAASLIREVLFEPGDPFCAPLFADARASIVFRLTRSYRTDGVWHESGDGPRGDLIGPATTAGNTSLEDRPEMVGAYLRGSGAAQLTGVLAAELADRVTALEDLWGTSAGSLAAELAETDRESIRLGRMESALFQSITRHRVPAANLDIASLTALIFRQSGQIGVQQLAQATGVSRQHLRRIFHQSVGVNPQLYCRLARFHATLREGCAGSWAQLAMGYADQSHMIAEFRRFSSLTPETLAAGRWFHPFLGRRWARRAASITKSQHDGTGFQPPLPPAQLLR